MPNSNYLKGPRYDEQDMEDVWEASAFISQRLPEAHPLRPTLVQLLRDRGGHYTDFAEAYNATWPSKYRKMSDKQLIRIGASFKSNVFWDTGDHATYKQAQRKKLLNRVAIARGKKSQKID